MGASGRSGREPGAPGAEGESEAPRPNRAQAFALAAQRSAELAGPKARPFGALLDDLAATHANRTALLSGSEGLSFAELAERARRYARFGASQGLQGGGRVALLMRNRPEYVAVWAGLSRIGATVALLGPDLQPEGLVHCLRASGARLVLAGPGLHETAAACARSYGPLQVVRLGARDGEDGALDLAAYSGEAFGDQERSLEPPASAEALQIFTSGTTGLPKAARISHRRALAWMGYFAGAMRAGANDRLYDPLPLHHSVGGVAALGAVLVSGGSVVLREKFSASAFWREVAEFECTIFQYVGELCRYLLAAPPDADAQRHRLRLACGNGLAADVWARFKTRFAIPQILEFYAATEGNFSLFNFEEREGALGRLPPLLAARRGVVLIQVDPESLEPLRDAAGWCRLAESGAPGEAIAALQPDGPQSFEGYADPEASERKILRDAFAPGDAWFRSGDLLRRDAQGFFYFVDRLGETFRWKGENVASAEVLAALRAAPGVRDAAVYGVKAGRAEGRIGMAAIVPGPDFDRVALLKVLVERLAPFARPAIVRLLAEIPLTETLRPKLARLALEGFDPERLADPLLFLPPRGGAPEPLTAELYARILAGEERL